MKEKARELFLEIENARGPHGEVNAIEAALASAKREGRREAAEAISKGLDADPHQWSKRPCPTCSAISKEIEKDFGCVAFAKSPLTYSEYAKAAQENPR